MKTEIKNKTLRLIALLFIAQCLVITKTWADGKRIPISAQSYKCKWGTVNILEQEIELGGSVSDPELECTITDVPKGFRFHGLLVNGFSEINYSPEYEGPILLRYSYYSKMESIAVVAEPLPITQPSDLVDVINAFEPGGAELNEKGEVVVLKTLYRPSSNDDTREDVATGTHPWHIQANLTITRQNGDAGISIGYFNLDVENSHIVTDGVMSLCSFSLTNSTIGCKNANVGQTYTIESTSGNVQFKGVGDNGEELDNALCDSGKPSVNLLFYGESSGVDWGIKNSTISFENLAVSYSTSYGDFIIPASATVKMKNCSVGYNNLNVQGGKVHFENVKVDERIRKEYVKKFNPNLITRIKRAIKALFND